jgi:orotate phosphoribosyltransferase
VIDWAELGISIEAIPDAQRDRERRLAELARDVAGAAYLRGDFVLSSGERSSYYFDKYLFETRPGILRRLAAFMAELVPADTDRIAGTELGAVALATALSLETGLPFVIARKGSKTHGTARLVEGELYRGDRVILVEDVVSTGAQAIQAAERVVEAGAHVTRILAVIDREQGGQQAVSAAGFELTTLFRRRDLGL